MKASPSATRRTTKNVIIALLVFSSLIILVFYFVDIDSTLAVAVKKSTGWTQYIFKPKQSETLIPKKNKIHYSLNCTTTNRTQTCPRKLPVIDKDYQSPSLSSCPDYFNWIHEDLQPWKETGITTEMLERARPTANFRLVILNGKAYVETYWRAFQTRDVFTLWGILQLLKMYPGKVPDLDLIFDCNDPPVILSRDYKETGPNATTPPPLFRYCGSEDTLDIPFPDWSFWGWPEVNIKPWESLLKEVNKGNKKVKWVNRVPYAYWKGNPYVADIRGDLMKCNSSGKQDWNARLYAQNWMAEAEKGFKHSNLAKQCTYRYKIYIEGRSWSVSQKYILACNSPTLLVKPHYYDTFTRSLLPLQHYWPIKDNDKCPSIKFAVDWGNTHKKKAQEIGKAANNYINKNMTMEYVYDYMFHVLNEYSKLLRFKPVIPEKAVEFCSETMACPADGLVRNFMMDTIVKSPSDTAPCILPSTDPNSRASFVKKKENALQQVEMWQSKYWEKRAKHH
ncbi:hypothetical protein ACHQM5_011400 [Ranunculus cassubicifolius]